MSKPIIHKDAVIISALPIDLEMFTVINNKGQYFRAKGYGGGGETWVDDIKKAKIYGKVGPARSLVTWFANHHPKYPTPKIGVLLATQCIIVDESVRVNNAKVSKEKKELQAAISLAKRELQSAENKLKSAHKNADDAAKAAAEKLNALQTKMNNLN